jgi:hypothetical protein
MKAIHADPREIKKVFDEKYIIPDFQRPYSWTFEECDKLLEDFFDFYEKKNSDDDQYFLGNIVIHKINQETFAVIDGQQRLTSLLLFIKALYDKAGTVKVLEECLKQKNPLTSELTDELRVKSEVLADDKNQLYDIIFNNGNGLDKEKGMFKNYKRMQEGIESWIQNNPGADKLNSLIHSLLYRVVLLPIHCGSEDDALTIFETINNRGMSLSDADIFKAKLHHASGSDKEFLITKWNTFNNHDWLFRIYMHILRAKQSDTSKESALRGYFINKPNKLSDWRQVINTINLINEIEINWEGEDEVEIVWQILKTYPNYYWNFPLMVFLNKYGTVSEDYGFQLAVDKKDEFLSLLIGTFKYFFIKGIVHNSVNTVRDTVFKVCSSIEKGENYLLEYSKNGSQDVSEFKRRIENKQYGRYKNGLVLTSAYLNSNQNTADLKTVLKSQYHIEHILPKKWNNYDKWTNESWQKGIDSLGNLTPLEWNLNISAKNEFFSKKKEKYNLSKVQDVIDLTAFDDWHPSEFEKRHQEVQNRIIKFFEI